MTIPVFIASSERFQEVEWLAEFSIRENTESDVDIRIVRPQWYGMKESGCTGFTNVRWTIPQLCRELGYEFGIYLDVDMLILGDIAELWAYRKRGKRVVLEDRTDEVSICCATLSYPEKAFIHTRHKGTFPRGDDLPIIPLTWNSEDAICDGAKLVHFTALDSQPWFYDHFNQEAVDLYASYCDRYRAKSNTRGYQVSQ